MSAPSLASGPQMVAVNIFTKGQDPSAPPQQAVIKLLPFEVAIFTACLEAAKSLNTNTVVRVAGGWVRDKLLGVDNHDIDIALDNTTGKVFAEAVTAWLSAVGQKTSTVAVIQANPEQSKHLETATTRIYGTWIDFVNLRAESYDPGSRIPKMTFGTPEQDAERRDFTVNALFYNVTTNTIEDLTGRGISDLRLGLLRTPLDPRVTFLDDPLRVMRALRFASRFGFQMVPELRAAACADEVLSALAQKVSRERVGNELEAMLGGKRPISSARVLHGLRLMDVIAQVGTHALPPPVITSPVAGAGATAGTAIGDGGGASAAPTPIRFVGRYLLPPIADFQAPSAPAASASLATGSSVGVVDAPSPALFSSRLGLDEKTAAEALASAAGAVLHSWDNDVPACWKPLSDRCVSGLHAALMMSGELYSLLLSIPDPEQQAQAPAPIAAPAPAPADAGAGGSAMDVDGATTTAGAEGPWPHIVPATTAASGFAASVETLPDAFQQLGASSPLSSGVKRTLLYGCLLFPFQGLQVVTPQKKVPKTEPFPFAIMGDRLKRKHKDGEDVLALLEGTKALMPLVFNPDRLAVGLTLKNTCKQWWPACLVLSAALHISTLLDYSSASGASVPAIKPGCAPLAHAIIAAHLSLAARIVTDDDGTGTGTGTGFGWQLQGCWDRKPLFDGKALMSRYPAVKGPAMKPVMEEMWRWQLLHPRASPSNQSDVEELAAVLTRHLEEHPPQPWHQGPPPGK